MGSSALLKLASAVLVWMVVVAPQLARSEVQSKSAQVICLWMIPDFMSWCGPYIVNGATGDPSRICCDALDLINSNVNHRVACECYHEAVKWIPGYSWFNSEALPSKCNVSLSYPISRSVDCSRLNEADGCSKNSAEFGGMAPTY